MHPENTGSSQQAQVCCLFILKLLNLKIILIHTITSIATQRRHVSGEPLPLDLPLAHLQVLKVLFLKESFWHLEGKAWGGNCQRLGCGSGKNSPKVWSYNQKSHWCSCKNQKKTPWQRSWDKLSCFPLLNSTSLGPVEIRAILCIFHSNKRLHNVTTRVS